MKNYHNILFTYFRLCILLSHRAFDIYFWVNIGSDIINYISYDPDSVSGLPQKSRKMALAP